MTDRVAHLSDREKRLIEEMCVRESEREENRESLIGACATSASSAFLIGDLGHSGFRKRWTKGFRIAKAKAASDSARNIAKRLVVLMLADSESQ